MKIQSGQDRAYKIVSVIILVILGVRQGKSFDTLAVRWELGEIEKPPFCRTDFYSCRRRFFANLDKELKERGA